MKNGNMLLDLGNIKISTQPVCSRYKISGAVNGFYNKVELRNIITEHKIEMNLDLLDDKSTDVLIWNTVRSESRSELVAFINVKNQIIESKIIIKPHLTDIDILNSSIYGVTRLKLIEDVKDIFCGSDEHINELSLMSDSFEAKVRAEIATNIGDVVILCEKIEYTIQDNIKRSVIPIGLGEIDNCSPIVLATIIEENGKLDLTDVENKISHLLIYEDGIRPFRKVGERIRRKHDMNYRKTHYDGESLDKKTLIGKTDLVGKVKPNRGREELSEDESESESESGSEHRS